MGRADNLVQAFCDTSLQANGFCPVLPLTPPRKILRFA